MKNQLNYFLCWLAMLAFASCQSNSGNQVPTADAFAHIQDSIAKDILTKAINRAGGLEKWQAIDTLNFQKYFLLYDSSGIKESEMLQTVECDLKPGEQVKINWREDGGNHSLVYQNGQVTKSINGQVDTTADQQSLLNSVQSATFVISLPFKLVDQDAVISYAGVDTLENYQVVEVLQASYGPGSDTWWHYFSQEDYIQIGYMVQHADHYSYVKNLRYAITGDILFPLERESYRVDESRNKLYLRAKYQYQDYKVTF